MKTITFIFALMLATVCFAQNNLMETRNRLQRELQTTEATWMTTYNLAYIDILMTFGLKDNDMKFRLLDEAEGYLSKLSLLKDADQSEVEALKVFRYLSLMNITPSVNGPKYGGNVMASLGKALKQNPNNPRAIILSAMYQSNLAAFMNKKYEEYDVEIARAKALLQQQDSTRSAPLWGMNLCNRQ